MNNVITSELISKAYSYNSYKTLIKDLLLENKTTGKNQSEKNIYFTRLNVQRTKRIEKTTVINEELEKEVKAINHRLIFLVIAEAWCGDVAQNLPVINRIAELNSFLELKIILRDENENVMNEFLTNGGKAIPVCIIINPDNFEVTGRWGPRPAPAQEMTMEYKKTKAISHDELTKNIQLWYLKDKTQTIQNEFLIILKNIKEN
ncbi:MAG: thioredoxin family protein [Bacteroidota bacterium]|nr:thioredoxin family protein [Bacteroidota bacterium]